MKKEMVNATEHSACSREVQLPHLIMSHYLSLSFTIIVEPNKIPFFFLILS